MFVDAPIVAAIEWPFLALAVFIAVIVLSWPAYRRLARVTNLSWVQGNMPRSLDAALRLHKSWLPPAILARLVAPGTTEGLIALRHFMMSDLEEAVHWAERGLRRARKPGHKQMLRIVAAHAHAQRGDADACQHHLNELATLAETTPPTDAAHGTAAISCYHELGRPHEAVRLLCNALLREAHATPADLLAFGLQPLNALGNHDAVLRLAEPMLRSAELPGFVRRPAAASPSSSLGTERVTESMRRNITCVTVVAALRAAKHTDRWDLYAQYLERLDSLDGPSLLQSIEILSCHAELAAHEHGYDSEVVDLLGEMEAIVLQYPRDRRLRTAQAELTAEVWQRCGEHSRVVDTLAAIDAVPASPMDRSWHAATVARSLEALGQTAAAEAKWEEAFRLAPHACWNRAPIAVEVPVDELATLSAGLSAAEPGASLLGVGPIPRVASRVAVAAWIVAVVAMTPIIGPLAGIALGTLSLILLLKRHPLAHDRRVGWGALGLCVVSLALGATTCTTYVMAPDWDAQSAEPDDGFIVPPEEGFESEEAFREWLRSQPNGGELERVLDAASQPTTATGEEMADVDATTEMSWPQVCLYIAVLVISVAFHEIGHAVAACWAGDPTARDQGRFSVNPLSHLSWVGSLVVPLVLFLLPGDAVIGWAKPVPVQERRFRRKRRGLLGVTLAGVSMNLLIAFIVAHVLVLILGVFTWLNPTAWVYGATAPFVPTVVEGAPYGPVWAILIDTCKAFLLLNVVLAGFNLLPLPPLDGFGALRAIAPASLAPLLTKLTGAGMIILLCLIAFNALTWLLMPTIAVLVVLLAFVQVVTGCT